MSNYVRSKAVTEGRSQPRLSGSSACPQDWIKVSDDPLCLSCLFNFDLADKAAALGARNVLLSSGRPQEALGGRGQSRSYPCKQQLEARVFFAATRMIEGGGWMDGWMDVDGAFSAQKMRCDAAMRSW